jgi:hypothetical protein
MGRISRTIIGIKPVGRDGTSLVPCKFSTARLNMAKFMNTSKAASVGKSVIKIVARIFIANFR